MDIKIREWDNTRKCMYFIDIYGESLRKGKSYINMLYVGIMDNKKKDIYVGDILKYMCEDKEEIGEVALKHGCARFNGERLKLIEQFRYEVIGNIYENKELLNN